MPNDQKTIDLATEYLPYINIPEAIIIFISELRPRLSVIAILVYLHYWRHWRYKDYKVTISNQDLADQLGVDASSIKRAHNQLVRAGLIRREVQKRKCRSNKQENLPSITFPAVSNELVKRLQATAMRKPYCNPYNQAEITDFSELMKLVEVDDVFEKDEDSLTHEDVRRAIKSLFVNKQVDINRYNEDALIRQVTWSIFEGDLRAKEFSTDQKRLNVALKLIRKGTWKKPRDFPVNSEPRRRQASTQSEEPVIEF